MFLVLSLFVSDSDFCVNPSKTVGSYNSSCYYYENNEQQRFTVDSVKKFLGPVSTATASKSSTRVPEGVNEKIFNYKYMDKLFLTGFTNEKVASDGLLNASNDNTGFLYQVYDVTNDCSSWVQATTSAMSVTMSRWSTTLNLSAQFVADCDLLGDHCVHRDSFSAYSLFLKYSPVTYSNWDTTRSSLNSPPVAQFSSENCGTCYPTSGSCLHNVALSGSCDGSSSSDCPIYYLNNWKWIKQHLFEVGAVTSTIMVPASFFTYTSGIYTPDAGEEIVGSLDVTIIGWGQTQYNLSTKTSSDAGDRFWIVIPHLGCDFGVSLQDIRSKVCKSDCHMISAINDGSVAGKGWDHVSSCGSSKGYMMIQRRYDAMKIESNAVGAVPVSFRAVTIDAS